MTSVQSAAHPTSEDSKLSKTSVVCLDLVYLKSFSHSGFLVVGES